MPTRTAPELRCLIQALRQGFETVATPAELADELEALLALVDRTELALCRLILQTPRGDARDRAARVTQELKAFKTGG